MNEFQSPYIDGQVIPPEEGAPSLHGFESSQPLSVPSKKIQGCSRSASECLQKTKQLAHEFNHGTYCAAHLVLAMTLIPNATRQFDLRKVDIEKAFRAAMSALTEMERGSPNHRNVPRPSEELSMIVGIAEDVAKNRDNQEVSVDDLLTAVDRMPAETSAAQLLRGERKGIPDLMIRESLLALSDSVAARIHGLQQQVQSLEQEIHSTSTVSLLRHEMSDLKAEMARQNSELDRKLNDIAVRLSTPRMELPRRRRRSRAVRSRRSHRNLPESGIAWSASERPVVIAGVAADAAALPIIGTGSPERNSPATAESRPGRAASVAHLQSLPSLRRRQSTSRMIAEQRGMPGALALLDRPPGE